MRYLDDPYIEERLLIARAQELCKTLAYHKTSLLPQRLRSRFGHMHLRCGQILREIERRADQLSIERGEEDRRGETA